MNTNPALVERPYSGGCRLFIAHAQKCALFHLHHNAGLKSDFVNAFGDPSFL